MQQFLFSICMKVLSIQKNFTIPLDICARSATDPLGGFLYVQCARLYVSDDHIWPTTEVQQGDL